METQQSFALFHNVERNRTINGAGVMKKGMKRIVCLVAALVTTVSLAGCQQPKVVDDLSDVSYPLVASDNSTIAFPDDVAGEIVVLGYIYTHCPDVCPMTTANMNRVRQQLGAPDDVQFVTVTFDPLRDTPAVMKRYSETWGVGDTDWMFLTGDTTTVNALMRRVGVRHRITDTTTTSDGEEVYLISHSDLITLIDRRGRIRQHYSGSRTPPEILVEDINKLRNGSLL